MNEIELRKKRKDFLKALNKLVPFFSTKMMFSNVFLILEAYKEKNFIDKKLLKKLSSVLLSIYLELSNVDISEDRANLTRLKHEVNAIGQLYFSTNTLKIAHSDIVQDCDRILKKINEIEGLNPAPLS